LATFDYAEATATVNVVTNLSDAVGLSCFDHSIENIYFSILGVDDECLVTCLLMFVHAACN